MKFLKIILILSLYLHAEITSDDLQKCQQGDYKLCASIGKKYISINSPDYNFEKSQYYLKLACEYGKINKSCQNLVSYYRQKNDIINSSYYLDLSCKYGDNHSCSIKNSVQY